MKVNFKLDYQKAIAACSSGSYVIFELNNCRSLAYFLWCTHFLCFHGDFYWVDKLNLLFPTTTILQYTYAKWQLLLNLQIFSYKTDPLAWILINPANQQNPHWTRGLDKWQASWGWSWACCYGSGWCLQALHFLSFLSTHFLLCLHVTLLLLYLLTFPLLPVMDLDLSFTYILIKFNYPSLQ